MNKFKKWCHNILSDCPTSPHERILGLCTVDCTVYVLYHYSYADISLTTITCNNLLTRHMIKNVVRDFPYMPFPDFKFSSLLAPNVYYTYNGKTLVRHSVLFVI